METLLWSIAADASNPAQAWQILPRAAFAGARPRTPSSDTNLPGESAAGSGIMIVLAVGLASRRGAGPAMETLE